MTLFGNQSKQHRLDRHLPCYSVERLAKFGVQHVEYVTDTDTPIRLVVRILPWPAAGTRITRLVGARDLVIKVKQVLHIAVLETGGTRQYCPAGPASLAASEISRGCCRIARCRLYALTVRYVPKREICARRLIDRAGSHSAGRQHCKGTDRQLFD